MYGYGYRYNSGLVVGSGGGGGGFTNTYSLDFDGVDDYIYCGKLAGMDNLTTASLSFWVKANTLSGTDYPIGTALTTGFQVSKIATSGLIQVNIRNGTEGQVRTTVDKFEVGVWINITFVYNSAEAVVKDRIRIYKNGIESTTTLAASGIPSNLGIAEDFYIGSVNALGNDMSCSIDEVGFFDYALTPAEVLTIGGTIPTDLSLLATPPLHWYRNGDNGAWKSPQWLIPNNENKDKVSNYSFEFDGIDDKVELGTQSFGITGAISVSAWVKIPTSNTGGASPNIQQFVCEDRLGGTNRNWALTWRGGTRNYFSFTVWNTNGSVVGINSVGVLANDGNWHHLLGTYDGTTSVNGLKLFVDGVLNVQATMSSIGVRSSSSVIPTIGSISNSVGRMFEGNIDEVSIFNTDQSSNVSSIYNGGEPTTISGALAHYKMGEEATFSGGVWTVPDEVGSNDGTSANMTIEDRVGEAPNSTNNALSYNMDEVDRVEDTP